MKNIDNSCTTSLKMTKTYPTKNALILSNHPHYFSVVGAMDKARKVYENMTTKSCVIDREKFCRLPRFHENNLVAGRVIGRGGFNNVCAISHGDISKREAHEIAGSEEHRNCSESKIVDNEATNYEMSQYVMKRLHQKIICNPKKFRVGVADLLSESLFLSSLDHPNIIKIRGISSHGFHGCASNNGGGFFIIMDRLKETLNTRIKSWVQDCQTPSPTENNSPHNKTNLAHRLGVAHEIATAMSYLHEKNIIFRDLKPENIGFDNDNKVKLFDFGLAKEVFPEEMMCDGNYALSGRTGSLLYMSPEVAKCQPYNLSADVYSFGILLWQICSLEKPFGDLSNDEYMESAIRGMFPEGKRPEIQDCWPSSIKILMRQCWSENSDERPIFCDIVRVLKEEVTRVQLSNNSDSY